MADSPIGATLFETRAGVDPSHIAVRSVRGTAEISRPFRYEIELLSDVDFGIDEGLLDDMLRQPASISWGDPQHEVHGVLNSVTTLSVADTSRMAYRVVLEPRLSRLRYATRSRVFQDKKVDEIVAAVLTEHGLSDGRDFSFQLSASYPSLEYTVQYQESDLDFVSRLLEHYGIHYHFGFQRGHDELSFADSNDGLTARATTVPYQPGGRHAVNAQSISALERTIKLGPASVFLTEFNWRTPRISLSNQVPADTVTGYHMLHEHGVHYKTPSEGAELARVRAERIVSERERFTASGMLFRTQPGCHFELTDHPLPEYDGRRWLVVRSDLEIALGDVDTYQETLELRDTAHPYRPPHHTKRPKILGFIHGRIDAPAHSTAAPVDEHGRYKVLLPFDLNGRPGGAASRWIRVAQPSSGPGFGMHLTMHLGAEVVIAHLGGDPDRPVIVGSVHNSDTNNPVATGNATQSWIKTQAGVRVLFDDDVP